MRRARRSRPSLVRTLRTIVSTIAMITFVTLTCALTAWGQWNPNRPNVVIIMADDLGYGDVGFNGSSVARTPHLDDLARSGCTFTRFYSQSPVCSPTRGALLTGRNAYRYLMEGANKYHLPAEEATLSELLWSRGYVTGHFGKWHLGTLSRTILDSDRGGPTEQGIKHYSPPWEHGFFQSFSTESKVPTYDPMLKPISTLLFGPWWDPISHPSQGMFFGTYYWSRGSMVETNLAGDNSRVITDRVESFVRFSVDQRRPFLAVVMYHAPHRPVVAGPEHTGLYPMLGRFGRHYFGCITAMDEQIGRIRLLLRQLGVAHNTIVWFSSDNGPDAISANAPGSSSLFRGHKAQVHEGGLLVPAAVEWPNRIPPGLRTSMRVSTADIFTTVLEATGTPAPADRALDGISIMEVFRGRMNQRPTPIAVKFWEQFALIDNRYKLHCDGEGDFQGFPHRRHFDLYDLIDDPYEQRPITDQHPEIRDAMREELRAWWKDCKLDREYYQSRR